MTKVGHQKVNLTSANLSEEKLFELRRILPEAFSEDKIDWDKLRTVLGDAVDADIEKFGFTWAGKSNAIKNVLIPSKATLNPAPDESVKFDESENLFIEGDNLEVLKLLQKAYFEKVKMIYIDPPYNTGGDFVYKDNFATPLDNYLKQTGQKNGDGDHLTTNKETSGRFHSDWLSMMYPRLKLAWNLLRDDGVIFISIDDNEVHHLRMIMDEVFGEENFLIQLIWNKNHSQQQGHFKDYHEYIIGYARSLERLPIIKGGDGEIDAGALKKISRANPASNFTFPAGVRVEAEDKEFSGTYGDAEKVTVVNGRFVVKGGKTIEPMTLSAGWTNKDQMTSWFAGEETVDTRGQKVLEFYFNSEGKLKIRKERGVITPPSILPFFGMPSRHTGELTELMDGAYFNNPKPVPLIQLFLEWLSSNDDLILDFFAGSGTTAHAVMAQNAEDGGNRRWILVQFPEKTKEDSLAFKTGYKTIADIAKERIRRSADRIDSKNGFKVFRLSESNYPENIFEFDPGKTEEENKTAFQDYLKQANRAKLIDDVDETSVIYENIVKEGFSLNARIQEGVVGTNTVYTITDGERQFSICLDREIDGTTVKNITEWAKDATFICFDNALNDSAKANLGLHVELKTI